MGFNKKAPSSTYCFQTYNLKLFEDKGSFPRGKQWWEDGEKKNTRNIQVPEIGVCSVDTKSLFELFRGNLVLNSFKAS